MKCQYYVTDSPRYMRTPLRASGAFDLGTLNIVVSTPSSERIMVLASILRRSSSGSCAMALWCDNGVEYTSNEMTKFCKLRSIEQKFTPPYTPQLNGVADCMNRMVVEFARCMIEHAGLPKKYWSEAVMTSSFLRNRCPTRGTVMEKSSYQVWTGRKPVLTFLDAMHFVTGWVRYIILTLHLSVNKNIIITNNIRQYLAFTYNIVTASPWGWRCPLSG